MPYLSSVFLDVYRQVVAAEQKVVLQILYMEGAQVQSTVDTYMDYYNNSSLWHLQVILD